MLQSNAIKYISVNLNKLKAREIVNYIAVSLFLIIILAILECTLFIFSFNYVVYEKWVSWYFPVGVNIVAFILLPLRYWPAVFLGMDLGQIAFNHIYYDKELDNLWNIFNSETLHKILLLLPLIYIKHRGISLDIDRFKGLILILGVSLFYRGSRSLDLVLNLNPNLSDYYGKIPDTMLVQVIVAHILGGFVGILFSLMIAYSIIWVWKNYNQLELHKLLQFILSLTVFILAIYTSYQYQPEVLYLLRMLGVLVFIGFAYQFGWIGVMVAALCLNTVTLILAYGVNNTEFMIEHQTYLTTYGLTALLLGALVNEYNLVKQRLVENNLILTNKNKKLVSLNENIQQLSEKVIGVQEQERKMLYQTLHDELGQNVVALKIGLQVMKSEMKYETPDGIEIVNKSVEAIHSSVYDLMNWAKPSILEEGLFYALKSYYFRERLENANIKCHISILGKDERLTEPVKISIFRIIQETITNSIKYSQAKNFTIGLIVEENLIKLNLKDDGNGLQNHHEKLSGGFGLAGIRERVAALSGTIAIDSDEKFELTIELPMNMSINDSV